MKKAMLTSVALGGLAFGLFLASVAMAAPSQGVSSPPVASVRAGQPITPAKTITSTEPLTPTEHPVALAIADHFSAVFSEIVQLHEEGFGFGEIARAYFVARQLGGEVEPRDLLSQVRSGIGWGELLRQYGLHPGRAGTGGTLGDIMSNKGKAAPGQVKKGAEEGSSEAAATGSGHGRTGSKGKKG